jgi:hypothetical protein
MRWNVNMDKDIFLPSRWTAKPPRCYCQNHLPEVDLHKKFAANLHPKFCLRENQERLKAGAVPGFPNFSQLFRPDTNRQTPGFM